VYDLVDCGPRSRFLVRNPAGEVFVSHNSAGHGLNLQEGSNILVDYSSGWNLEHDLQVIERIGPLRQFQSGLNRPVYRYRIVCHDTVDELVRERRASKRSVQQVLLEAMKRRET
jgi:SNF2 family DNA or RNA helicase